MARGDFGLTEVAVIAIAGYLIWDKWGREKFLLYGSDTPGSGPVNGDSPGGNGERPDSLVGDSLTQLLPVLGAPQYPVTPVSSGGPVADPGIVEKVQGEPEWTQGPPRLVLLPGPYLMVPQASNTVATSKNTNQPLIY